MKIRKRDKVDKTSNRVIPKVDVSDFQAPDLSGIKPLRANDTKAIVELVKELKMSGFIERNRPVVEKRQTMDEVNELFDEAAKLQKYENENNPKFYDKEANEFLEQRELEEGHLHEYSSFNDDSYFDQDEDPERKI